MRSARRLAIDLSQPRSMSQQRRQGGGRHERNAYIYGAGMSLAGWNFRWKMTGQAGSFICMAPEVCLLCVVNGPRNGVLHGISP
jgi:hypothetical protein